MSVVGTVDTVETEGMGGAHFKLAGNLRYTSSFKLAGELRIHTLCQQLAGWQLEQPLWSEETANRSVLRSMQEGLDMV